MFPAFFSWKRGVKNIVWMGNGIRKGGAQGRMTAARIKEKVLHRLEVLMKEVRNVRFFDCRFIRCTDECTGSF